MILIIAQVLEVNYYYFFFFNSVLRPFQDYFSSYEMGQSVGGAKTGEPGEKPPVTPKPTPDYGVLKGSK